MLDFILSICLQINYYCSAFVPEEYIQWVGAVNLCCMLPAAQAEPGGRKKGKIDG